LGVLTTEQSRDQKAAQEEEDRDAESAWNHPSRPRMRKKHDQDRDSTDSVERRQVEALFFLAHSFRLRGVTVVPAIPTFGCNGWRIAGAPSHRQRAQKNNGKAE